MTDKCFICEASIPIDEGRYERYGNCCDKCNLEAILGCTALTWSAKLSARLAYERKYAENTR
jgi:hypothetical protein